MAPRPAKALLMAESLCGLPVLSDLAGLLSCLDDRPDSNMKGDGLHCDFSGCARLGRQPFTHSTFVMDASQKSPLCKPT